MMISTTKYQLSEKTCCKSLCDKKKEHEEKHVIIIDWISKLSLENTNTEDDNDWIIDNINE